KDGARPMTGLAQPASPLSAGSLTQLTLSLLAIVALILAISWALKRLKLAGPRGSGGIAVIDELSLGPRDRIALIRVGESQVLVGIGASGLVPLTPLAVPIVLKNGGTPTPAFAERLREIMKRPGGPA
ncbi:MAG TPA: flagellar biosynthetic protein FliO, partial [Steroidobacteraceae bacterium]